jgi:shikimate dehydrogenase
MTEAYGIIGYPLTHSFSPAYFAEKFANLGIDAAYERYEIKDINELPAVISAHPLLKGLNVTIPYKKQVMPLLHEIDADALAVGAVNCIAINNGKLKGYNTDVIGFRQSLEPLLQPYHKQALILGTGGSSNAVAHALEQLDIAYVKVSRQNKEHTLNYDEVTAEMVSQCKLIINTTPLGMHPAIDNAPTIAYDQLTPYHLLFDLVYNPAETKFMALGKEHGAVTQNGLEMLHLQAEASWNIWNS